MPSPRESDAEQSAIPKDAVDAAMVAYYCKPVEVLDAEDLGHRESIAQAVAAALHALGVEPNEESTDA